MTRSSGPFELGIDRIAGVVLEVRDLGETRAFYEPIFRHAGGRWEAQGRSLRFDAGAQYVEFVQRGRPRVNAEAGQHQAYRVARHRLHSLVDELRAAGFAAEWWREDHPAERELAPYLRDPSGNAVQLVSGEDEHGLLFDHAGVPVEDLEHGELFYISALGGTLDYRFGWKTQDVLAVRAWAAGDDPCAPWTRNRYVSFRTHKPNPTPAAQVFARWGSTYLDVILTGRRLPEPPEEILRGTPRIAFHAVRSAEEVAAHLAAVRISPVALTYDGGKVPFERDGGDIFLRDRSGNFVQITCEA